ncbi:chorismate mutase [Rhodococcus sp. NPDC003382]|nr:chorismate mutase [Rhodococcus sp. CX]MBH0120452.1 chorismate mutase [Rhodococcus sp. CX]
MTVQLDSPGIETAEQAASTEVELVSADVELAHLFDEIQELDAQILEVIKRRCELSQLIGVAAKATGHSREAQNHEMQVLDRFTELGKDGNTLALTLLRLGRTRLAS